MRDLAFRRVGSRLHRLRKLVCLVVWGCLGGWLAVASAWLRAAVASVALDTLAAPGKKTMMRSGGEVGCCG